MLSVQYTYPLDSEAVEYEYLADFAIRLRRGTNQSFFDPDGDVGARLARTDDDARVLDLGCGAKAVWCCKMAEAWPEAEVRLFSRSRASKRRVGRRVLRISRRPTRPRRQGEGHIR